MSSYTPDLNLTLLAILIIGVVITVLVQYVRTQNNMNNKVYFLPNKIPVLPFILIFLFIGYMTFITLQPQEFAYIGQGTQMDLPPLVDLDFYYSRLVVATGLLLSMLLTFFGLFQKTALGEHGLLYKGIVLNWDKFESYVWDNQELYKDPEIIKMMNHSISLSLTLRSRHVLYPSTFTFTIPFEDKPFIDAILATKFKVKGQEP
ncbi:MAG: hypothetical protein HY869_09805 [Chloroflexi bacterium]|nr:hypothetical protein [Chloroflexota bacterium]